MVFFFLPYFLKVIIYLGCYIPNLSGKGLIFRNLRSIRVTCAFSAMFIFGLKVSEILVIKIDLVIKGLIFLLFEKVDI